MMGANRIGYTCRINETTGVYEEYIQKFRFRSEPKTYIVTEYNNRSAYITFSVYSDVVDILAGDRIVFSLNGNTTTLVVSRIAVYTDQIGQHIEMLTREVDSAYHTDVIVRSQSSVQTAYDPLLKEWTGGKDWDEETLSVIVDPIPSDKTHFVNIIPAGKLEGTEYVMTVDLPYTLNTNKKIVYGGIEYDIHWEVPSPYQYMVGLTKSIKNYG